MAAKFILPTLALAGSALAQCSGPITIKTNDDASGLSSCTRYDGTITIDESASGQINLDYITSITGDLTCTNATQLTSLGADQLRTIGGTFNLESLTILSNLAFPQLNGVNMINWVAVPALQALNFDNGVTQANNVYISNTGLTTLAGIELTQVGNMNINNNLDLKTINVNGLTNVTNALSFSANGRDLEIEFPNLQGAANLTFRDVSSISMPSLADVGGALGLYENSIESFAAPNMTEIGGTIAIVDSPNLSNISFPMLETIGGGLQIANNSELASISGFKALTRIQGDIDFYGTFDVVALGPLSRVEGAANVYTSSQNTSICDLFSRAKSAGVIRGNDNCHTNSATPETNGTSTSSGSGSESSKSAANPLVFDPTAPLTGFAAFVAALLFI